MPGVRRGFAVARRSHAPDTCSSLVCGRPLDRRSRRCRSAEDTPHRRARVRQRHDEELWRAAGVHDPARHPHGARAAVGRPGGDRARVNATRAEASCVGMAIFELGWRGGATEARLHRRRPGGDDLPWGTVDLALYPADLASEARRVWSNGVFTEYASAAAFSSLT